MTVWGPDMVLRWFRTIQIGSVLIPVLGGLIWGAIAWQQQRAIATDHAVDTVTLVRQYSQRLFETEIIKHGAARSRANGEPADFLRSQAFHRFLAGLDAGKPDSYGLALISDEGRMVASSRSFPVDLAMGPRDYIDAIRGGSRLYIDRIKLEPGGADALIVASPFVTDGFRGMIVSSVATETSRTFLHSVTPREDEAASLLREDGKLLVRQVPSEPIMLAPDTQARQNMARASEGVYETLAVSDGVRRIYAFNQLESLPLTANFGVPLSLVFAATIRSALPVWLLMVAISAFTLVATALARRSMLSQRESDLQALKRAEAENLAHQRAELVREMNHRVKNNLSLVTSLINMQARRGNLDINTLQMRIQALAEVHDLLYRSNHGEKIDLGDLIARACDPATLIAEDRAISLNANLAKGILVCANRASPLALAALELVTNAVKHAFAGRESGVIGLTLRADGDGQAQLTIEDDGIGMPEETARRSGTRLVDAFVAQAGGTMTREVNGGTRYVIRFGV
ncbi:MAG: histidine kinase dimerization/phosphoacceptor domain -containing protein [Rhizobium sp.]|nr:histidine kinase dimerization/phosphoacceptor domain -containing protein [Rhizobium sp.]